MKQIKIGSGENNNVVLAHPSVSPNHLEILLDDSGNYYLTDLNTHYGTFVNGFRVQGSVQLQLRDMVKAGDITIPWQTYFAPAGAFQQTAPPPQMNPGMNPGMNPQMNPGMQGNPMQPMMPQRSSKKKLFFILGGGILGVLLIGFLLIWWWTRGSDAHLKFIPRNAVFVASINMKGIASKIDLDKIKNSVLFEDMKKNMDHGNDAVSQAMNDPMSSGIDIFSKPYFFMTVDHDDYENLYTGGIAFAIKNADDFYSFIQKTTDHSVEGTGDFHYVKIDGHSCVAWSKDGGIFIGTDKHSDDMKDYARSLIEQPEKESILSNDAFGSFRSADYDIGAFLNYDGLRKIPFIDIPDYMKGTAIIMKLNFNNGELDYSAEYVPSKDNANALPDVIGKSGINADLKKSIPGGSFGFAAVSVNMKGLYDYMDKDDKMSMYLDEIAEKMDMKRKDLADIFSGDAYFALSDFKEKIVSTQVPDYENYDIYNYYGFSYKTEIDTVLDSRYIVGITVNNPDLWSKMMEKSEPVDTGNGVKMWSTGYYSKVYYFMGHHGKNYFITNDYQTASDLSSNGTTGKSVSGPNDDLLSKNPFAAYMNLDYSSYPLILKKSLQDQMGDREYTTASEALKIYDHASLTGDGKTSNLNIYFKDKTTNCINTLYGAFNDAYKKERYH
ncbi:MAG: DUF4836 family protein [Bacteroidetes bacterium]|nr:DUF4836 family protein [Bacteroidota bacterium]